MPNYELMTEAQGAALHMLWEAEARLAKSGLDLLRDDVHEAMERDTRRLVTTLECRYCKTPVVVIAARRHKRMKRRFDNVHASCWEKMYRPSKRKRAKRPRETKKNPWPLK